MTDNTNPKIPLAAFVTRQHVPWCPDCAKHHHGACEDVDAPRDTSPSLSRNMGKTDDDDGSVNVVTDGSAGTLPRTLGKRKETFALGDMRVTHADGSVTIVPKRKRGDTKRTLAKRAREAAIVTEAVKYGSEVSMDERKRINGV